MIGRYYQDIGIDTVKGLSNYTNLLTLEALKYIDKQSIRKEQPFFLYWAPDSTHGPTYSSSKFSTTRSWSRVVQVGFGSGRVFGCTILCFLVEFELWSSGFPRIMKWSKFWMSGSGLFGLGLISLGLGTRLHYLHTAKEDLLLEMPSENWTMRLVRFWIWSSKTDWLITL